MAVIKDYEVWTQLARQQTNLQTAETTGFRDVALLLGGMQLKGSQTVEDLETEHRFQGTLFKIFTRRNDQEGTIRTPLYNHIMQWLLQGALLRSGSTPVAGWGPDAVGNIGAFTVRHYWATNLDDANNDIGQQFVGVIPNSLSFTVDRTAQGGGLEMELSCFVNEKIHIDDGALPTSDFKKLPFQGSDLLIDADLSYTGAAPTWGGGDNTDIVRMTFNYSNNLELDVFTANVATPTKHRSWTQADPGAPTLSIELDVRMTQSEYAKLDESLDPNIGAIRFAAAHPSPNNSDDVLGYSETFSAQTLTAGNTTADQTLTTADTTPHGGTPGTDGLVSGDIILINDGTNFDVTKVSAVVADTSFNIDTDDADMHFDLVSAYDGGATPFTVNNQAFMVRVPRMTLVDSNPIAVDGNKRIINLVYEAVVEPTVSGAGGSILTLLV